MYKAGFSTSFGDRSNSRLRAVSGTFSGTGDQGVRKMKVAPVDIFVYGVHKETSFEDIVEELKYKGSARWAIVTQFFHSTPVTQFKIKKNTYQNTNKKFNKKPICSI